MNKTLGYLFLSLLCSSSILSMDDAENPEVEGYIRPIDPMQQQVYKTYKETLATKHQRLKRAVEDMYQSHVATAEYFDTSKLPLEKQNWLSLLNSVFLRTFQNFIWQVHYLHLDTHKAHMIELLTPGVPYQFKQFNNDKIISLVMYRPNGVEKVPMGIFNHGGTPDNFMFPGQSNPILMALGGLGYGIVCPNYRGGTAWQHAQDMQAIINYLHTLDFADTNKIVLSGISEGTYLNSLVLEILGPQLAGVFLHTGFYGRPSPSPFDRLINIPPTLPIFLASGVKDEFKQAGPNWVIKYVRALQDVSDNVSFFLLEQGGHQLINLIYPEIASGALPGNIQQILEQSSKRYNADEVLYYVSHLVEFLDKVAYGDISSPYHHKLKSANQYKRSDHSIVDKDGIEIKDQYGNIRKKWEQKPGQDPINNDIKHQIGTVARFIVTKAQTAQSMKGRELQESQIPVHDLLLKDNHLAEALYTFSEAQLKIILEEQYNSNNLEETVTRFLEQYDREKITIRDEYAQRYPLDTDGKVRWWDKYIAEETSKDLKLIALIVKILKKEREYKGAYVNYHATEAKVGFIYDVYSALRRLIILQITPENQEQSVIRLRLLDDAFMEFLSASDLIEKMRPLERKYPTKLFNNLPGYQGVGISAQWFLFGSYKYWMNSTFFRYFRKSSSASEVNVPETLKSLFSAIGLQDEQQVVDIVNQYTKFYNTSIDENDGRLLQIFISPSVIDEMTYVAETGGAPLDLKMSDGSPPTHSPSKIIAALVQDPLAVEGLLEKRREDFKCQETSDREEFSKQKPGLKYVNSLESRDFMKLGHMDDQTKVQIVSYHLLEPCQNYMQTIDVMAAKSLAVLLATYPKLGMAMTRYKPPLMKLQDYVIQGMTNQGENIPKRTPFTLYDLLSAGKWNDAEQWVNIHTSDIEAKIDNEGHPLLYQLLREHKYKAAEWLVKQGVPLDGADSEGNSMVIDLIERDELEAVDWLIDAGLTLDSKIINNETLLLSAINEKNTQKALWLISHNFNIRTVGSHGFSPLIAASMQGLKDIVQEIINKAKKELNSEDFIQFSNQRLNNGITALNIALLSDHKDIMLALMKAGADFTQLFHPDYHNAPALEYALSKKHDDLIQEIIKNLPNYRQNNSWLTLRMAAILYGNPAYRHNAVEFFQDCLQLKEIQGQNPYIFVPQMLLTAPETKDYAFQLFEEKVLSELSIKAKDKWAMIQGFLGTDREKAIGYLNTIWKIHPDAVNDVQFLFDLMNNYTELQEFLFPKVIENVEAILSAVQTMPEPEVGMNLGRLVNFLSFLENRSLEESNAIAKRLIDIIFQLPENASMSIPGPALFTLIEKSGLNAQEALLAYSESSNVIPQFFINLCQGMSEKEDFLLKVYKGAKTNPLLKTKFLTELLRDIAWNENLKKIITKEELIEDLGQRLRNLIHGEHEVRLLFETMAHPHLQEFLFPKILKDFETILTVTQTMPEHEVGMNLGRLVNFLSSLENRSLEETNTIAKHLIDVIFQLPENASSSIPGYTLLTLIEKSGLDAQETLLAYSESSNVVPPFFINLCQGMPEKENFLLNAYKGPRTNPLLRTKILIEFLRDINWNETLKKNLNKDELMEDLYKQFKTSVRLDQKIQLFESIAYDVTINKQGEPFKAMYKVLSEEGANPDNSPLLQQQIINLLQNAKR